MALQFLKFRSPSVFISYRREDTRHIAGRIFDRLVSHFGKASVFMDIEDVPIASKFRDSIRLILDRCDVLLAVIGPEWTGHSTHGQARILNEQDVLRVEIETALDRGILIIPVLIDQTSMPSIDLLPPSLRPLTELHAAEVRSGRDFDNDMRHVINFIEQNVDTGIPHALAVQFGRHPFGISLAGTCIAIALALGLLSLKLDFSGNILGSGDGKNQAVVQACNNTFAISCAQAGGAFGSPEALAALKSCRAGRMVRSDEPFLQWKDIWTTSVYSFAPQGGGPGGGKDDEVLKSGDGEIGISH